MTTKTSDRTARTGATAPSASLPLIVLCAAVLIGAFLRWPAGSAAIETSVFATADAREAEAAARSLSEGMGFTVEENGARRPARTPAGEVVAVAAAHAVFGKDAGGLLTFEALLSSAAIVLAAIASWIAGGPLAGAAAALFLALDASQILSTRVASPVPVLTCLAAASLAAAAWGLTHSRRPVIALGAAGLFAGLAATVHPLAAVLAAGLLVASLTTFAWVPGVASLACFAAGFAPVFLQPAAAAEGAASRSAEAWLGIDAASPAIALDRDYFVGNLDAAARLVLAAFAILGILSIVKGNGARAVVGFAAGCLAALFGAAALRHGFPALPHGPATAGLVAILTTVSGLGLGFAAAALPLGIAWVAGGAALPVVLASGSFLAAVKMPPGKLSPSTPSSAPESASSSPIGNGVKTVPEAAPAEPPASREKPAGPVSPASRVSTPTVESTWRVATIGDLDRARKVIAGEGGMTRPAVSLANDCLLLTLRLDNKNLDRSAAEPDAVRLCLKILADNPKLDGLRVRTESADGKHLSTVTVPGDRARPFIAKLDDPFESRRMREWWPRMKL